MPTGTTTKYGAYSQADIPSPLRRVPRLDRAILFQEWSNLDARGGRSAGVGGARPHDGGFEKQNLRQRGDAS